MKKKTSLAIIACLLLAITACKQESAKAARTGDKKADNVVLPDGTPPTPHTERADRLAANPENAAIGNIAGMMQYNSSPIDPLCFAQLWEGAENPSINLAACKSENFVRIDDPAQYSARDSFIGTAYRPADIAAENMPAAAFIEYKFIGPAADGAAILVRESGGGTGLFSSLYVMKRTDDELKVVTTIAGGDRCNGGIESANVKDGQIYFTQNMTLLALYGIGTQSTPATMPDAAAELPDCAVCCYGLGHYNGLALQKVTLPAELETMLGQATLTAADAPAACGDKITLDYIKAGNTTLDTAQLAAFAEKIKTACFE